MEIRRNPHLFVLILLPLSFIPWFFHGTLESWVLVLTTTYLLVPLILSFLMGFSLIELGFKAPSKRGWKLTAVFMGAAVVLGIAGTFFPSMVSYYPRFSVNSWSDFLKGELIMGIIMFAHEAFFRGFLLFPLAAKEGKLAIPIQDIPYTLVHLGKPAVEVPYSFFAGIVFGWLDLESESFLPSFLVHWIGSAFFDLLCVLAKEGLLPWIS